MTPNARRIVFWTGLALYLASYFLPSIVTHNGPAPGWSCLEMSILIPIIMIKDHLRSAPALLPILEELSVFVAALINPIFWLYAIAAPFRPTGWDVMFSRILIPLMIPSCWIIFNHLSYRPREGHFVWVSGMLLVLVSGYSIRQRGSDIQPVRA